MSPEIEAEVLKALEEWRAARAAIFAAGFTIDTRRDRWVRLSEAEEALMAVAKKVSHAIQ